MTTPAYEIATAIFDKATTTFTVKTPKGEFKNVKSIGGFDNYRQMDEYIDAHEEDIKEKGVLAYLFNSPAWQFLFYYPDGGDIGVDVENWQVYTKQ